MKHLNVLAFSVLLLGAGCSTSATVSETTNDLDTAEDTTTTTETVRTKTVVTDEDGDARATADITADITTTISVDCNADGNEACLAKKFAACEPATLLADMGFASFSYEIVGPASGGCKVTVKYPTNPNPEWVNQPMTCTLDNSLEITAALSKQFDILGTSASTCTGPLAVLMK